MSNQKTKWVVLCVLLVFLSACLRQKQTMTTDTVQSAADSSLLPASCQPIEPVLVSCKNTVKTDREVKNLLAVLGEQLQTAQVVEQEKTCQDVLKFWQTACDVM